MCCSSCSSFTDDSRCCFLLSFLSFISPLVDRTCPCLTESRIGTALASCRSLPGGWRVSQRPLLLLTCHLHVARSVFPLSRWPHHATAPWFSCPSAHTHPRTHSQPHQWTCDGVRPCEMRAPTYESSHTHTEDFRFCLRKEKMANSCQLEALKTINYRVTRLKESKRAALCSFSLWERGWRICQNCRADQQTAK